MSLRKAINDKCKECIYDSYSPGTWRQQTSECTSYSCALFPHRPLPIGASSEQRKAVIASDLSEKGVNLSSMGVRER